MHTVSAVQQSASSLSSQQDAIAKPSAPLQFFVVGHDCGHRSFSKNKLVEDIVGTLMFMPLIYPFEPWRIKHNVHHAHTNKCASRLNLLVGDLVHCSVAQHNHISCLVALQGQCLHNKQSRGIANSSEGNSNLQLAASGTLNRD